MAFRNSATTPVGAVASGAGFTATAPPGYVAGDILEAVLSVDTASATLNAPAGWTLKRTDLITNGDGQTIGLLETVATGTDSFVFGFTKTGVTTDVEVSIAAYSGRNTTTPNDVASSGNNPNSLTPPSSPISITATGLTTVQNGDDVVWLAAVDPGVTGNGAWAAPGTMTLRTATPSSGFCPTAIADLTQGTAGATGNKTGTWTQAGDSGNVVGYLVALAPAAGGTTYNLSISESGTAADAVANALTAANALTFSGAAADALSSVWTGSNALAESGAATDSVAGGLVLANSISEAGTAADAVTGTPTYLNTISDSGAAADAVANSLSAFNALSEAASAADAATNALTAVNSVSESGSATDAVSFGSIYQLAITESVAAADALDSSGSTFNAFLIEALNSADAIVADGGSAPVVAPPAQTQGGSGFARGGKKRKVVRPEDRAPEEGYAVSPFATSAAPKNTATPKGGARQKAAARADYSEHRVVIESMLKELL